MDENASTIEIKKPEYFSGGAWLVKENEIDSFPVIETHYGHTEIEITKDQLQKLLSQEYVFIAEVEEFTMQLKVID